MKDSLRGFILYILSIFYNKNIITYAETLSKNDLECYYIIMSV